MSHETGPPDGDPREPSPEALAWVDEKTESDDPKLELIYSRQMQRRNRLRQRIEASLAREKWLDVAGWLVRDYWAVGAATTYVRGGGGEFDHDPAYRVLHSGTFEWHGDEREKAASQREGYGAGEIIDHVTVATVVGEQRVERASLRDRLLAELAEYPGWDAVAPENPTARSMVAAIDELRSDEQFRRQDLGGEAEHAGARARAAWWRTEHSKLAEGSEGGDGQGESQSGPESEELRRVRIERLRKDREYVVQEIAGMVHEGSTLKGAYESLLAEVRGTEPDGVLSFPSYEALGKHFQRREIRVADLRAKGRRALE